MPEQVLTFLSVYLAKKVWVVHRPKKSTLINNGKYFIEGGCDTYARDCIQRFRINRMSGYAALYQDFHSKDIEQAIDETQSLEAMMESLV